MQILTHNPSLSSVSRYPVAFELPRAETRRHQPDLPRVPTPRAFARVSSLSTTNHLHIRYRTYLVLLFNTTSKEILVLFVQSRYIWLLGILITFCIKGVCLAQPTQSDARAACFFFRSSFFQICLSRGERDARLNSLNVRVSEIYEYMVQ